MVSYFFQTELDYDPANLVQRGTDRAATLASLHRTTAELDAMDSLESAASEARFRSVGEELGLSPRQYFGTLRVASTGRNATPPLFDTMEVLGMERVAHRIRDAIAKLEGSEET